MGTLNGICGISVIRVDKLQEFLNTLEPDDVLTAKTRANTGNLLIIRNGLDYGYIDIRFEEIETFEYEIQNDKD